MTGENNYPGTRRSGGLQPDNLAFWFDGLVDDSYWHDTSRSPTLPKRIDEMKGTHTLKIRALEHDISKHRKKNIKGKEYWYFWADGKHNSKGPVEGRPDPRDPLRKEVEELEKLVIVKEKAMLSCVVHQVGKNAVIDVAVFKKFVDRKLPPEATLISDMLNYPVGSATSRKKPDNKEGSDEDTN